jgi:hypothetical protein
MTRVRERARLKELDAALTTLRTSNGADAQRADSLREQLDELHRRERIARAAARSCSRSRNEAQEEKAMTPLVSDEDFLNMLDGAVARHRARYEATGDLDALRAADALEDEANETRALVARLTATKEER